MQIQHHVRTERELHQVLDAKQQEIEDHFLKSTSREADLNQQMLDIAKEYATLEGSVDDLRDQIRTLKVWLFLSFASYRVLRGCS